MSYDEHLISMAGGDGEPEPLDLDAIQARADAATEGPWKIVRHDLSMYVESRYANLQANLGYVGNRPEANADFIAHARTDVPALLALVRDQQAKLDAVEKLIERPFASADKKHYEDDFNRGHVAGYNAAAHLLRKAIDGATDKP